MVQSNRASAFRLLTSVTFQKALCCQQFSFIFSLSTLGKSISRCLFRFHANETQHLPPDKADWYSNISNAFFLLNWVMFYNNCIQGFTIQSFSIWLLVITKSSLNSGWTEINSAIKKNCFKHWLMQNSRDMTQTFRMRSVSVRIEEIIEIGWRFPFWNFPYPIPKLQVQWLVYQYTKTMDFHRYSLTESKYQGVW
jgi:hypothetical protein